MPERLREELYQVGREVVHVLVREVLDDVVDEVEHGDAVLGRLAQSLLDQIHDLNKKMLERLLTRIVRT